MASALSVSPAKVYTETKMTIENTLDKAASYTAESECVKIDVKEFKLTPTERKIINVIPECNGQLEIKEETDTAINRMRIPVTIGNPAVKKEIWKPASALAAILLLLAGAGIATTRKIKIKEGKQSTIPDFKN